MSAFRFLDLPRELRDAIYEEYAKFVYFGLERRVVSSDSWRRPDFVFYPWYLSLSERWGHMSSTCTALPLASKQVYKEFLIYLAKSDELCVPHSKIFTDAVEVARDLDSGLPKCLRLHQRQITIQTHLDLDKFDPWSWSNPKVRRRDRRRIPQPMEIVGGKFPSLQFLNLSCKHTAHIWDYKFGFRSEVDYSSPGSCRAVARGIAKCLHRRIKQLWAGRNLGPSSARKSSSSYPGIKLDLRLDVCHERLCCDKPGAIQWVSAVKTTPSTTMADKAKLFKYQIRAEKKPISLRSTSCPPGCYRPQRLNNLWHIENASRGTQKK